MSNPLLLDLLRHQARADHDSLARQLGSTAEEVAAQIAAWEADGTILGYSAIINDDHAGVEKGVTALIEVRVTPERGGGFDRFAQRISKFDEVKSCSLISGGYDLVVEVEGPDLREVARFVSEKLSTIAGVISTATHFQLKVYKKDGFLLSAESAAPRLPVTP